MIKNHDFYIAAGEHMRQYSHDLGKQTWAVIVDEHGEIIGRGTNHLPFGVDERAVAAFRDQQFLDYFNARYELVGDLAISKEKIKNPKQLLELFNSKPYKYTVMEHAERKAIEDAAKRGNATFGTTMYAGWFPCVPCTNAIINSGIKKLIVIDGPDYNDPSYGPRWGMDWKTAEKFLELARVETTILGR